MVIFRNFGIFEMLAGAQHSPPVDPTGFFTCYHRENSVSGSGYPDTVAVKPGSARPTPDWYGIRQLSTPRPLALQVGAYHPLHDFCDFFKQIEFHFFS